MYSSIICTQFLVILNSDQLFLDCLIAGCLPSSGKYFMCIQDKNKFKYRLFVSIKRTGAQNTPPFLPKKSGGNSSSSLQNAGRFSKTFTAEILVLTAKYCLPQITYLLIHVFLINFRQGNVKLVLLKEFKPIILHVASENQLFCECRKFISNV